MIVSAHQPHYLPWCGYINKMLLSDKFVVMDNMHFTSYHYLNRNRIIQNDRILKLSLPVKNKNKSSLLIKDVELDYSHSYRGCKKHMKSIIHNYSKCKGFDEFFPLLQGVMKYKHKWLLDIDFAIINLIKDYLNINTETYLASELDIRGKKEDELFLSLLERTSSSHILLGLGASLNYINTDKIVKNGGNIVYQKFDHPVYSQNSEDFIKGVSIIDLLLNNTREKSINLINASGSIEK
ncbi:WbqC family protein [Vicingus serpentipes]|uniref:WbqC family protein n=1 Tax=Vicingus serpentipes TaxID=1926625 RepID=A0A5C6RY20_9FLAO|nr:WbqC family protein [Vicingus serpentipes]TXB67268.1 WbqC family protein [Vicingus serpentipes]